MKQLLLFLSLLISAVDGHGAIAVVQAASDYDTSSPDATVTITATSGNLLYVVGGYNSNGSGCGTLTVSDTASNTYTPISSYVSQAYNCSRNFYAKNITGGSITISLAAAAGKSITVYEVSGLDTTAPLDTSSSKTCSASPCTSASFSTAQADEIVFIGATNYYYNGAWSAGAIGGNTATIASGGSQTGTNDATEASAIEYYIFNSTQSSITGAISKSGSIYMDFFMAAFKAAAAASDTTVIQSIVF